MKITYRSLLVLNNCIPDPSTNNYKPFFAVYLVAT